MSLLKKIRTFQITTTGIRFFGMLCLAAGTYGTMLQTRLLGAGNITNNQLLDILEANPDLMANAGISILLQMFGACALPIFVFLLVEGATHTSHYGKYVLRVLGLAVLCQLPYNVLTTGNLWYMTKMNPVFALVLCMVMLYVFRNFTQKKGGHRLIKALAMIGTFLWSNMLGVEHGACCVILCAVMWLFRGKPNLQTFIGIAVMFSCSIFSMYYIAGLLSFLVLHFYEGNQGSENRVVNYLAYPVILVVCGLLTVLG